MCSRARLAIQREWWENIRTSKPFCKSLNFCLPRVKVEPGFLGRGGFRAGFEIKYVKMFRADFGPAYNFLRNDGHFYRYLLMKQSSWLT